MKRRNFIKTLATSSVGFAVPEIVSASVKKEETGNNRKLFITGGSLDAKFIGYIAGLTQKENPKVCFVPTATGDNAARIAAWYESVEELAVRPYVLRSFINSGKT